MAAGALSDDDVDREDSGELQQMLAEERIVEKLVRDPEMIVFDALTACEKSVHPDLVDALVAIYLSKGELNDLLFVLVGREVSMTRSHTTILRGTTYPTALISAHFFVCGRDYLHATLHPILSGLLTAKEPLEDPCKISDEKEAEVAYKRLQEVMAKLLNCIYASAASWPPCFRVILAKLREEVVKQFPDANALQVVSSLLFLRLICPAIVSPTRYGIVDFCPAKRATTATLVAVSKALQCVANRVPFGSIENAAGKSFNEFLSSHDGAMELFCEELSTPKEDVMVREPEVGAPVYKRAVQQLVYFLKKNQDDLGPMISLLDPSPGVTWGDNRRGSVTHLLPPMEDGRKFPVKYDAFVADLDRFSESELLRGISGESTKETRKRSFSTSRGKGLKRVLSGKFNRLDPGNAETPPPGGSTSHRGTTPDKLVPMDAIPRKERSRSTPGTELEATEILPSLPPPGKKLRRTLSSNSTADKGVKSPGKERKRASMRQSGPVVALDPRRQFMLANQSAKSCTHIPGGGSVLAPSPSKKRTKKTRLSRAAQDEQSLIMMSVVEENLALKEEIKQLENTVKAFNTLKMAYAESLKANEALAAENTLLQAQMAVQEESRKKKKKKSAA